jgi:hypothetical protein
MALAAAFTREFSARFACAPEDILLEQISEYAAMQQRRTQI